MSVVANTSMGTIKGNERANCFEFLGVRYAKAERFEYAEKIDGWEGEYDATQFGGSCPQTRTWFEHLEVPERMFYHREYRNGLVFKYTEDCLNLNIYTPKEPGNYPVIVFIHGGGFNSGASSEDAFDGDVYAKRGVVLVTINYRVGVLGYLTHEDIFKKNGREGNFGLDDQIVALKWVKEHIADFSGDPENVTVMGQSAGAISIQYLCLNPKNKNLFKRAIMLSGAGQFPSFSLPRPAESTREYWKNLMEICKVETLEELKALDLRRIFESVETIKTIRKDSIYNTMPVIDGVLLTDSVKKLIKNPNQIDYMIGYTNNDMVAAVMAHIGNKYAKKNDAYVYYFDIDAPGEDKNGAFHSCDLRYVFGTLIRSHRPYDENDYRTSNMMAGYISQFAKTGNPNGDERPEWVRGKAALCITKKGAKMGHPGYFKLLFNTLTKGDPK